MEPIKSAGLSVKDASKRFLKQKVLENVSFTLNPGTLTLLLGANGSGKSTLLRACAGLNRLDKGEVRYGDLAPGKIPYSSLGFLGHHTFLYSMLTSEENINLASKLLQLDHPSQSDFAAWGLEAQRNKPVHQLSKGQQARLALMRVLISKPNFVLLDEPTSSLDEGGVGVLLEQIAALKSRGGCALIATHDIARLSSAAERVMVLNEGTIAADGAAGGIHPALNLYSQANR